VSCRRSAIATLFLRPTLMPRSNATYLGISRAFHKGRIGHALDGFRETSTIPGVGSGRYLLE
jgi:hypothetical protein